VFGFANAGGPALGGFVIAYAGFSDVYLLDAICAAIFLALLLPVSYRKEKGAGSANGRQRGGVVRDELVAQLKQLEAEVGFSLSRWALRQVARVNSIDKVRNFAHLQSLLEKTTDVARGVERLRSAIATNGGSQRYATLVRELNLASDAIDDIPDRATLRVLVTRMEEVDAEEQGV
ncbi:MAG: hypothetical protein GY953_32675, partial [bacterium]|nr:hypothetical protein [bacterium]